MPWCSRWAFWQSNRLMSSLLRWCIGTFGAEDFASEHLISSLSDALVLSPMGNRTSDRTWSSSLDSPAHRELAPYLCFETSDEVSSELAMGRRKSGATEFPCFLLALVQSSSYLDNGLDVDGELDVSMVNWTSQRWIGRLIGELDVSDIIWRFIHGT